MKLFNLKGKTAIITGGGSGIGKAISETFAAQGVRIHVLEYREEEGGKTVNGIKNNGGKAEFHQCDVSKQGEVIKVVEKIGKTQPIHILINNAGVAHVGNVETTTEEDLDRLYQVNIKGVYNCLYAVVPYMKRNGGGCIINMASIASVVGISDRFAYSMSKGAALTMTYSIAKDYIDFGIRCNCISPARIHTPFVDGFIAQNYQGKEAEIFDKLSKSQPLGRMGTPDEVAGLAVYLCSDEASFITGTNFPIDGGYIKLNG
ncbi:glucose 1-dehydrogenase [Salinimicrobium tongyeongense]|uniref:Glucose 1-dehydrogenase n=1 Tax=Salinimicrobium tongyeongense TaxID=2809707 RepID=A0ABY6NVX7_9FLAO|nr:glucose 1-dehydrogenase [Salinimicrobium tongyeongense]UZH56673.1 glucose 1-dehydrogenase [Salinimicrobium tongyeongense]